MRVFLVLFLLAVFASGCVTADDLVLSAADKEQTAEIDAAIASLQPSEYDAVKTDMASNYVDCVIGFAYSAHFDEGSYDRGNALHHCRFAAYAFREMIMLTSSMTRTDWKNNTADETLRQTNNAIFAKVDNLIEGREALQSE